MQTWHFRIGVGQGEERTCSGCGESIAELRPRYKLEFASAGQPLFLHLTCYDDWYRRFAANMKRQAPLKTDS